MSDPVDKDQLPEPDNVATAEADNDESESWESVVPEDLLEGEDD